MTIRSPAAGAYGHDEIVPVDVAIADALSGVWSFEITLDGRPVENGASIDLLALTLDSEGVAQSLLANVDAADAAVARGQPQVARLVLGALALEVSAQRGKHIAAAAADLLAQDAPAAMP